jgi:hypothetical protein
MSEALNQTKELLYTQLIEQGVSITLESGLRYLNELALWVLDIKESEILEPRNPKSHYLYCYPFKLWKMLKYQKVTHG